MQEGVSKELGFEEDERDREQDGVIGARHPSEANAPINKTIPGKGSKYAVIGLPY